jgi:hypothetical protein
LLFGDKNLSPQVTDELAQSCDRRRVKLRPIAADTPDAAQLKPVDALAFEQRRDMHPLPESLAGIDGLRGLKYVKGKDKVQVLLVRPSTGIVVDEVAM